MHGAAVPPALPRQRFWLGPIVGGFVLLAAIYSVVTPLFEASDELWHYPMVKYIADHGGLPVQDPARRDDTAPWRQEGSQPPLYYMIGAAATFWIDTNDMREVRRLNPHVNMGEIVPDRNVNIVVHNADRERFPWSGTVLAVHIVRFLSILMGAGTVYLTYRLGCELFPAAPAAALAAAAFTAFNPMFLFVSAVINNDNLSTLLATLLLWLVVQIVRRRDAPPTRFYVLLGLAAGAGMLSKFQIGFMLPLIALALLILSLKRRDWRPVVVGGAISGGLTVLIAGWWYWRNYDLYGDATGINVFLDIVGRRAVPADLHQLLTEREAFMMAFWGFFGGVNVPMNDATYTLFNLLAGFAIVGLGFGLGREMWFRLKTRTCPPDRAIYQARAFAAAWAVIVFLSLLSWTRLTWASQGRLWFSAIAPLSVGLAVGLASWAPRSERIRRVNLITAAAVFASIAAVVPFTIIRPAYRLDRQATWKGDTHETAGTIPVCFGEPGVAQEALCMAARPIGGTVRPGEYARFSPVITVKHPMSRDWSIFVHFVNRDGVIEAQRDVYPGMGLLATSDLEPGDTWNNLIAVLIPKGVYTPQTLDVFIGFYDLTTSDRMIPIGGSQVDTNNRRVYLGQLRLETPPGQVPNPVNVNFADVLTLRGYEVSDRSLKPGDTTTVTLYWEARQTLSADYVISVQVIDPDPARLTKAAQVDAPADPPTSGWRAGAPHTIPRDLAVYPEAAPGRYRLLVRVYPAGDPAHPLRVRTGAGGQSEDFVWLAWIQVEPS